MYLKDIEVGSIVTSINLKSFKVEDIRKTYGGDAETLMLSSISGETSYSVYKKTGKCLFSGMSDLGYDIKIIDTDNIIQFSEALNVYDFVYNPFSVIGEENSYLFSKKQLSDFYTAFLFPVEYSILTQDKNTGFICNFDLSNGDMFLLARTKDIPTNICISI